MKPLRGLLLPAFLTLFAAGCSRSAVQLPTASESPVPVTVKDGVKAPQIDPGANPGQLSGQVPTRRKGLAAHLGVVEVRDVEGRLVARAKVNQDGGFQVNLPPGDYTVSANAPGYKHMATGTVTVGSGQVNRVELKAPDS
ncbi:MAG TPA: carboxypeptidase-like regulatory domain-containing protein [Candidatus Xenobia bacterium]|jgi:hypothetical protein